VDESRIIHGNERSESDGASVTAGAGKWNSLEGTVGLFTLNPWNGIECGRNARFRAEKV